MKVEHVIGNLKMLLPETETLGAPCIPTSSGRSTRLPILIQPGGENGYQTINN
jgi:hypothetical protein